MAQRKPINSLGDATPRALRPRKPKRPQDPCKAGLDLLRWQVLFLQGSLNDRALRDTAPAHGIDPEFWSQAAHEYALKRALRKTAEGR